MPMSVIEYQDPTGEIMVARVPAQGTADFLMGSQLIVQDGQIAVFFRDGRPTDGFRAGRHSLTTESLPVISRLLNLAAYGLKSPFRAYVYYIHLRTFTNLGWGTSTPVLFHDSKYGDVPFRAHGSFSVRVADPSLFLRTLIGSKGLETTYAVELFIRDLIVSAFAAILSGNLTTVSALPTCYRQIGVALKKAVHEDVAQYGLELVDLIVGAITLPDEVRKGIERAAASRALDQGELGRYQAVAMADALRDSASQPAGGGMAQAASLGAAMQMGHQFVAPPGAAMPAAAPPPVAPASPLARWHVAAKGKQFGPYTDEQMRQHIATGAINGGVLVWRDGLANWTAAAQVPELASLFVAAPPPPPPPFV
jgi:membrane protease subunit (stomatin/prohibitin family)